MDPEFQRAITIVLIGGGAVTAIATFVLFLVFRSFGGARAGTASHGAMIALLIGFVFVCCLGLLAISYSGR